MIGYFSFLGVISTCTVSTVCKKELPFQCAFPLRISFPLIASSLLEFLKYNHRLSEKSNQFFFQENQMPIFASSNEKYWTSACAYYLSIHYTPGRKV